MKVFHVRFGSQILFSACAIFVLLQTISCRKSPTTYSIQRLDQLAIETVLLDLLRIDSLAFPDDKKLSQIVLDVNVSPRAGSITADQIKSELDVNDTFPPQTLVNLQSRNSSGGSWANFVPSRINISLHNLNALSHDERSFPLAFKNRFPNTKAFVRAWLPGYDQNKQAAMVRVVIGPSPHAIMGTYMLTWHGNGWSVQWRNISYLV